jgi:hypothetical protein
VLIDCRLDRGVDHFQIGDHVARLFVRCLDVTGQRRAAALRPRRPPL